MDVKRVPRGRSTRSRVQPGTAPLLSLLEGAVKLLPRTLGRDSLPPCAPAWCRGSITPGAAAFGAEHGQALCQPVPCLCRSAWQEKAAEKGNRVCVLR